MANHSCRCIGWCISGDHFDSAARVPKVRCPVMFIHGKKDGLIDYKLIEDLFTKVNSDLVSGGKAWLHLRPVMYHNCYHIDNDLINPGYDIIDELSKDND